MTKSPSPAFEIDEHSIGWIIFDDPERSVNVLSESVMRRLAEATDEALRACQEARVRAVVIRGKDDSFIAGADINLIGSTEDPEIAKESIELGQEIFSGISSLPVPTIAAVHGACVGGGVELSLACDHRVLSSSHHTTMSLPEVQLGILPAWGGTTRLTRLIGLRAALDMLLSGRKVSPTEAKAIGLASAIIPAATFHTSVKGFAQTILSNKRGSRAKKRPGLGKLLDATPLGRSIVLRMARKKVTKRLGEQYPAPLAILDVLTRTMGKSVAEGLSAEASHAATLLVSPVCKNLVHVFHLRQMSKKGTGLPVDSVAEPSAVSKIGVLGAGVMGGGIAQLAASRGLVTWMKDIEHAAVTRGLQHARSLIRKKVARHRMTTREARQAMDRISGGIAYHGLSGSDIVVEAIVEEKELKKAAISELEEYLSDDCVIATNTSSLSVKEIATALQQPQRFCGMHFFNPVHRMPLVEVIRAPETSDAAIATTYKLALNLGKVPVVVSDGPGFLVNRILGPYMNEAGFLLSDGASIKMIDSSAKRFGMPMGPLRLLDEVGIDIATHAGSSLYQALGERLKPAPALVDLGNTGRLGKKGGRGFYLYEGGRERQVDDTIYVELPSVSAPDSTGPGSISGDEGQGKILRRLVLAMINEAARTLEEGIVISAADVDLAMIMGTGFPPFRGGLLRFADTMHPRGIVDRLEMLAEKHGARFEPAPALTRLASEDLTFYSAFPPSGS